jgi:hypothetical protein
MLETTMKFRRLRTTFAVALVVLLLGLCLGDVVHAAMPGDAPMDCGTRLCEGPGGCAPISSIVLQGLPWATVPAAPIVEAPNAPVRVVFVVRPSPPSRHQLLPSAPRSPPLA